MRKKITAISCLLAIVTILTAFGAVPLFSRAETYTNYEINGVTFNASSVSSSPNECWAYANGIYHLIWGQYFDSYFDSSDNFLRGLRDEELTLTAEHLKEYISAAPLGCSFRVCNEPNLHANDGYINGERPGHNQIIVARDENGFTVVQGGLTPEPHYREDHYTWQEFIDCWWLGGSYRYIKYIKWPSAPSYAQMRMEDKSAPQVYDAVYPKGTLMYDKKFSLGGVIYSPHRMTGVTASVTDMMGNAILYFDKRLSSFDYSISSEGLDAQMPFRALTPGGYTYEVKVTDVTGAEYTVIRSFFTVAASKLVNEEIIFNFLINNGFHLAAACGVLANIEHESYFNPLSLYLEKGGYYSHGLIQWNLGRYDRLKEFCRNNGYDVDSIEGQLRFMMLELTTDTGSYKKAWDTVCSAPNTSDGAYQVAYNWCYYYEMPSDTANRSDQRGQLAREYYERYSAHAGQHVVSFDARGGTTHGQITVNYASPYPSLPTPSATGREFIGWFTMPEGGVQVKKGDTVWITSDQLLFAHYENLRYGITYDLGDDATVGDWYEYGERKSLPLTYEREGYYFDGWYEDPSFSGEPVRALEPGAYGNKTFYAKWRLFTGIVPDNNGVRYLNDGEFATGFFKVGGNTLYFRSSDGYMLHYPSATIGGESYSFEPFNYNGLTLYRVVEVKNGIYAEENSVRLYRDGQMQTGWQYYDGVNLLYFDENGLMVKDLTLDGREYRFERFTPSDPGLWDLKLWRAIKNGLYAEDGGLRFYKNSVRQTGWQSFDGKSVYFSPEDGLMVTTESEIDGIVHPFVSFEYEGFTLYADDYKKNGFFLENGSCRYYENDVYRTGWFDFGYNRMFFDYDSGSMLRVSTTLGGVWYDFEPFTWEGLTLYRVAKRGFYTEDGGIRYYREGGYATGWVEFEDGTIYFDPSTGLMRSEAIELDGILYGFEPFEYGGMTLWRTTYSKNGFFSENGGLRYYVDGEYRTGFWTVDGETLYFSLSTGLMNRYPEARISLIGRTVCFEEYLSGDLTLWRMTTPKDGIFPEDGGVRYYEDGVMRTGWIKVNGNKLYFSNDDGFMVSEPFEADGILYEFEPFEEGALTLWRTTYRKNGLFKEDGGVRFYVDDEYRTGFWTVEGNTLYFSLTTGLMNRYPEVRISLIGRTVCFEEYTSGDLTLWRMTDQKEGFFPEDGGIRFYRGGRYLTGHAFVDGNAYLFDARTGLMITADGEIDGVNYTFGSVQAGSLTVARIELMRLDLDVENAGIGHVTFMLNFMAGSYNGLTCIAPDVNEDGELSISDVSAMLDLLSGKTA